MDDIRRFSVASVKQLREGVYSLSLYFKHVLHLFRFVCSLLRTEWKENLLTNVYQY